jgi:integrase
MSKVLSSNLATPTGKTPEKSGVFSKVRQTKKASAPSIYDLEFTVEGPNSNLNIEEMHNIKIIDCQGDLSKRWYVEYYITDSKTQKKQRKREYGFVNKIHCPTERYEALTLLKSIIIQKLESKIEYNHLVNHTDDNTITYYMNEYLRVKRRTIERESNKLYTGSLKCFHNYLKSKNMATIKPHLISKKVILDFLNEQSKTVSNRSVNNHLEFIKAFFNYLINNHEGVLLKNPCFGVQKLPSNSENHIAYSRNQAQKISEYLKENDVTMLHFCRFIAYGFLRCKETRNLKVGDIDFDKRTITLSAKNAKTKKRMIKPILETFFNYLLDMKIKDCNPNYYIFTVDGKPGPKKCYDNYFQKRFKKVKKNFSLNEKYTIYSFRHTFVCELLDSGASWHEIMKYTGHTTFTAFEKYARSILNKPAQDLSSNIKINF